MKAKIEKLLAHFEEIENSLSCPNIHSDQKKYKELSQQYAYLSEVKETYHQLQKTTKELDENRALLKKDTDPAFALVVREDSDHLELQVATLTAKLENLLIPPDLNDHANVMMEIRAGTGGDEAAIFVGDCVRMYYLYADRMRWKIETLTLTQSESGGYKEYTFSVTGKNTHRYLQYEGGTHRVQRVPATETQGRIHTSAITVAVLMEPKEEEKIEIDDKDLKIDTYRASGAGGQHVNTTDSAVRITHIPTGSVAYCQEERSQHKNKEKALRVLVTKLAEHKRQQQAQERASIRSSQVGSGDRSERIRTYNYFQNRVTDHRINLSLYKLDQIMEGDLQEISEGLIHHFQQEKFNLEE